MGFLQAYGQSNAPATFNDVMKNMAGVAKAGYDVRQNEQEMAMKEKGLGLQEAYTNIARAKETREAEEFARKKAIEDREYPAEYFLGPMNQWDDSQKAFVKLAADSGLAKDAGGRISITGANIKMFGELLRKQPELMADTVNLKIGGIDDKIGALRAKMAGMPPEKQAEAEKEMESLLVNRNMLKQEFTGLISRKQEVAEKVLLEGAKGKGDIKGFNQVTNRPVIEDARGNLWEDGKPYTGGPLKPLTESKESQTPVNVAFAMWKSRHPNATSEESQKELERLMSLGPTIRAEAFRALPTNIPGVFFDRIKKKYYMNSANGEPVELSSEQTKRMKLEFIEETPVTNIKAMQQNAPSVLFLSGEARKVVEQEIKNLGPLSSRWRDFWAGKIGAPDPSFTKLRTNLNLLQTKLSQMHVGAQGGIEMVRHFKETIEGGKQSPENMLAALGAIEAYAAEVGQKRFSGNEEEVPPPPPSSGGTSFATEAEATAAAKAGKIRPGDRITVGGKAGTWR